MDIDDTGVPSNNGFDPEFAAAADWARLYRSAGVQIVPCKNKVPRLKSWKEYQNALVPDAQFEAWYGQGGEFSQSFDMGALTGNASGRLLMIDLDLYKAGGESAGRWWRGVLATHNNSMPLETWEQVTGGGGRQMFFTYPPGWRSAINAKTDINVDIRCQGGFAVLPPTQHASGNAYAWIEGSAPWEIDIAIAPDWLLEEVERLIREHGGGGGVVQPTGNGEPHNAANTATASSASFDAFGHQTDGRESFMRDLIYAAIIDWRRERYVMGLDDMPTEAESLAREAEKYLIYRKEIGLKAEESELPANRGAEAFHKKWVGDMQKWHGKIAEEAKKPGKSKGEYSANRGEFSPSAGDVFEMLSVADIKAMPDPQWLVEGMVVEQALGFIYGPPGCLKTFIALNMALSLTTGKSTWWGRGIQRKGAVLYICSEGVKSLKFRIAAWEIHHKTPADAAPFKLIRQNINFMQTDDVNKLLRTVQAAQAEMGPIAAVFVDTVSRVLPGAEENLQKDMTLFVAACDAVRQLFGATVVGLHHTNANGGFRGSTVMPGAGDFLIEVRREPGARAGSIYAKKIKDDEDGWEQPFKMIEVPLPGIVARTNVVVESDTPPEQREGGNKEKASFDVREQILSELHRAWSAGNAWSHNFGSSRSGVKVVMKRWGLSRNAATEVLDTWLARDIIREEVYDTKNKSKGYRKLKDL
jgi:hypothetical protein